MKKQCQVNSLDHTDLREKIADAVKNLDEVKLSANIDKARCLGNSFKWKDELDQAEILLYEITCSGQPEVRESEYK